MDLSVQKRIAADILKCGVHRVVLEEAAAARIKEAITKADMRSLIAQGIVRKAPVAGTSRVRANKRLVQRRLGRQAGPGTKKGRHTARAPSKRTWINKVRSQRAYLQDLRRDKKITQAQFKMLYAKVKGDYFRSKRHIGLYLAEAGGDPMSFNVRYRRRRQGRTNYHKRLKLLQSGLPRLVVRRSNTGMRVQVVAYQPAGDTVLAQATAKDLRRIGFTQASGKSLPGAYLIGYAAGLRAKKAGVTDAIVDIGMQTATKGNRLFAAVKGALDAGLRVPVSDDVLPSDERLLGKHIEAHRNVTLDIAAAKQQLSH